MGKLEIGISTSCYYPELTEFAVRRLVEAGVDCMELFFNADSELSGPRFDEILRILASGRTKVLSVHPFTSGFEPMLIFSDYERRFLDSLEYYKRFFHAAATLGASYLIFHGDRSDSTASYERYFERYYRLDQTARSFGVMLAQENVSRCRGRSLEFLVRMKAALGENVVFALDFKQARRSGTDYHDLFSQLGGSIRHLHVSDYAEGRDCLPVGEGNMDFRAFLEELVGYGYQGAMILELYRQNYEEYEDLLRSYRFMKREAAEQGAC